MPFALAIATQVGFILHMVALPLPLLGPTGSSLAVTGASLAAMVGRLRLGVVIHRLPSRRVAAICFVSQACGLGLVLAFPGSEVVVYTVSVSAPPHVIPFADRGYCLRGVGDLADPRPVPVPWQ